MLKKIKDIVFERNINLREQLFRMILVLGQLLVLIAIIENIVFFDRTQVFPLCLVMVTMAVALYITLKYKKSDFSMVMVGIVLISYVFPYMFFLSGGVESGVMVWFALELVYVFLMFSGIKLAAFVLLCVVVDLCVYGAAYIHPEWVVPLANKQEIYVDSVFSAIAVGCTIGGILKYQIKIFMVERKIVLSQKDEIEKMSNSKNTFYAGMSHEIRTPIHTIIGFNDMILRENSDEEIREYAQNIQMASKMLLNLVNDILDVTRMEMEKMEIIPVSYKTAELFGDLVDMVQVQLKEKKLDFYVEIDQSLPSVLFGDEKRIKQILLNILNNAVKYTEKGSVTLSAYGEPVGEGEIRLKIAVSDTGVGIRKEDLEYLYDTFKRIDERKNRKIEGSGLGLAISKNLLDLMGGEITVDSIYTKGSIFTVALEQKVVDSEILGNIDFLQKKHIDLYKYEVSFEAPEARILIVDDNPMNILLEEQMLKNTKVQIDIAKSGLECLEKTKNRYYHVILMDYLMADMTGGEVLKELRKQENGLCRESYVLLFTAASSAVAKSVTEENGFDGYLEKPITGRQLEKEVMRFLPEDIIEYQHTDASRIMRKNSDERVYERKKKKIYITTDGVCDLVEEYVEKYDIKIMYLYIKTEQGRFADTIEIDSDSLSQYLVYPNSTAYADSASVEEYEEFFAEMLTQAEHVIHISMAKNVGKSYGIAAAAAQGFDHVQVIDSGTISCGEGLIVLYAAKLAKEGWDRDSICEEIEKKKGRINSYFLLPNIKVYSENGHASKAVAGICKLFRLHPVVSMQQSKSVVIGIHSGNLEESWRKFIRRYLWRKKKISAEVIFITYVGCSVKQLEFIREEILKYIPFERVIMQKGSFANACNSGMLTIGISYYKLK